ncbi:MAG: EAL domain-containing protein [Rhizobiales bacterium]|nr:EAL domain-containing protein [Hyphomicrobiales bacterium]
MKLQLAQIPKLLAERRSTAVFGVVIIAMLWSGICFKYIQDIRGDAREAERTNRNFAMVFEENVLRSIGEIDKSLLYLRRIIETRQGTTDLHTIVSSADLLSEIIVQVAIIDANGIMRASNAGPQPAPILDLSDREHFRVHLDSPEDRLFISKPLIGRASRQWSVQLTRRFRNSEGKFGGVVVTSLNPAHLTEFYNRIDFGASASIALIGQDGVVRSSGGGSGGFELGQDLSKTTMFRRAQLAANSTFEDIDPVTGKARLVTFRQVRGHPLLVSVSLDHDEIFHGARAEFKINALVGLILTLILLAAMERILATEAKARQKAEQLQLTLENMSQGIMLVTNDQQIPVINSRCAELLDLPPDFIKNPPRYDRLTEYQGVAGEPLPAATADLEVPKPAEPEPSSSQVAVSERMMPNGSVIESRRSQLPDGSFVQTFTDITERRESEARVARLASEDPLTGLPNRRVFRATLDDLCRRYRNQWTGTERAAFAILFMDVDRFKVINDTLGHRVGDMLLQEVAKRLETALPSSDILARLGGDEFAVVVPAITSLAKLEAMARQIVEAIVRPYEIDGYQIRSSVSIGIAVGPRDGDDVDDLLMAADLALYAVKADGRGAYKFYNRSMNSDLNERRELEINLRDAIDRNELELHYQPVIDLRRNVITGFEALARWCHPSKGMVPPAVFIPVAEDSGLIIPIGEWALREACRQASQWPNDLRIAVNLSPVQILAPNLPEIVQRALSESGLAAHRLEIEITERIIMEDTERTLSNLRKLKDLGVRIAMDDFGTGYSSLSYLRRFPFDKIKVDRTFVSDLTEGTENVVIVQAVISIARSLGLTTTAEGVEIGFQRDYLTALGYDEAQGYLFSPAVPIAKVPELIAEWTTSEASIAA